MPTTSKRSASAAGLKVSEHDTQVWLFDWMRRIGSRRWPELNWAFAIPNGGHRHPAVAAKLKAEGVTAGVPDICLPVRRGKYAALFIELKSKNGRVSDEQQGWLAYLRSAGFAAFVCFGRDDALSRLEWYLTL